MEGLHDAMGKDRMFEDFPETPFFHAVFFEANQDGIPRALVTSKDYIDRMGCTWYPYYFKDGTWRRSPLTRTDDPNYYIIGARFSDFYTLTEEGKKPKFVVIYDDYRRVHEDDPERFGVLVSREAYQVTIDSEGYLKTIPMPEFEFKDHFLDIVETLPKELAEIKLKSPNDTLERIPVQTFNPEAPPVTE